MNRHVDLVIKTRNVLTTLLQHTRDLMQVLRDSAYQVFISRRRSLGPTSVIKIVRR